MIGLKWVNTTYEEWIGVEIIGSADHPSNRVIDVAGVVEPQGMVSRDIGIRAGSQDLWSGEQLSRFVESIRNYEGRLDLSEFYQYVDEQCEVFHMVSGRKLPSSVSVNDFILNVKLGGSSKVVTGTIKYNSTGKIIEFCQQD